MKDLKNSLQGQECIIILDFAENYSFLVQDTVQGFHCNNAQATIHPFFIYFVDQNDVLCHLSIACISDEKDHNTITVYAFIKVVLQCIREKLHGISKVYYFSDGCSGQYKNHKNLTNLLCHKADFSLKAEWHFVATSNGKNACDDVGGIIKRPADLVIFSSPHCVFNIQLQQHNRISTQQNLGLTR